MKPVGKKGKAGKRGKLTGGGRKLGGKPAPGGRPGAKPRVKPGARSGGTLDLADNPRVEAAPGFRPGEAPLLLMPMRLEYRVIEARRPPKLVDRPKAAREIFALRAELAKRAPEEAGQIAALNAKLRELTRQASAAPRRLSEAKLEGDREIWLRWYPDGNFAERGIAPPSEAETEALEAVLAHPFARDWPRMNDGGMIALWAELAAIAGPERAVHLMRNYGKDTDPEWEARIGRIVGLPQAVAVYALDGAELVQLGKGAPIPANAGAAGVISYSPAVLGEAGWMSDFATALDAGMGMKLTEPKMVDLALAADWLICVGISSEGQADLDSLLRDAIANGAFEFLRQDSPTNNAKRTLAGGEMDESTTGTLWALTGKELNVLRDDGIAADRLATALGLEKRSLDIARGGEDAGQLEAAAMIRVIGPALMDGALAATTSLADIEDTAFIELLATHVQARGILPAVRLGDGAYGILPITDAGKDGGDDSDLEPAARDYSRFIRSYASVLNRILVSRSQNTTMRIEPGDEDASDKLTDILQTTRVSRRLDVSDEGADEVTALGCPYVTGEDEKYRPSHYIMDLVNKDFDDLPLADHEDRKWPLLYRLAHLSLSRIRMLEVLKGLDVVPGRGWLRAVQGNWRAQLSPEQRQAVQQAAALSVRGFSQAGARQLGRIPRRRRLIMQAANRRFEEALTRLRIVANQADGTARLETLMMEVIDLFQHRLDAWITGLASIRLEHLRGNRGATGLALGWYGFLGRLREASQTGKGDGYLQAPSQGQAISAAVLRSAFLRGRASGAFEIDLSSTRTRRALKIMDHIRRGVPLPETLGLRGERWLRERQASAEIFTLREAFPLENVDIDGKGNRGKTGTRCFDGLRLIEASPGGLGADARAVRAVLAEDLDALSDVVVAEAVHHRAGGSAGTAAAWLRVLSGGPIPGRPEFLRSERAGQASDYRVTLVLPQGGAAVQGNPLRLAEYGLAALFDEHFPGLAGAEAQIRLILAGEVLYEKRLKIADNLGLDVMDFGRLGLESLKSRLVDYAISDLQRNMEIGKLHALGADCDRKGLEAAGLVAELDLSGAEADIAGAAGLWAMAHEGTPLSAGDLANAAAPQHPLDEPAHIAALVDASTDIWARAARLLAEMKRRQRPFVRVLKATFDMVASSYERPGRAWGDNPANDHRLRARVATLHRHLGRLSALSLEGGTWRPAASRLVADMVGAEADLRKPHAALKARIAALEAAIAARPTVVETLAEARADVSAGIAALRAACGAGELAIFPVFTKSAPLAPLLSTPQDDPAAALAPWPRYRAKLARLERQVQPGYRGYPVHPDATADDKDAPEADLRDERLAPRAYHRGVFVARDADMSAATISGLVVDEWVEKRPSAEQPAAIALNYDTPQAEAPNTMLLCVPAPPYTAKWDTGKAADHVRMALDLMQARALSTQTTPIEANVLPMSNLVAHVGSGARERPRIPEAKFRGDLLDWFDTPGRMLNVADNLLDPDELPWNQTRRFGRQQEGEE